MLVGKLTYDTQRYKKTDNMSINHFPSALNNIEERPLKNNHLDLSFKGLSLNEDKKADKKPKKDDKLKPVLMMFGTLAAIGVGLRLAPAYKDAGSYSIKAFSKFIKEQSGLDSEIIEKHFEHLKNSKLTQKLIKIDGDTIHFRKKTIPQLIWDGLMYPFKILPADILDGTVTLIGKIKPFKAWASKTLEKPMFKNIRQRSKIDAEVNSMRGLYEMAKKLEGKPSEEIASKMFQQSVKMFDSKTGNYDTKHERALNRLVSGLPPAIFLANDAYNLSRMMDDDEKAAKHEQKTRFKQEAARIGFNAYITLITLGALQKYINNSALGIMLMTGATTLTTEAFSRLINGKHITRLTPEEARAENKKNNAPEADIKPEKISFKSSDKKDDKQQKPLLSFDTLMKASAVIIAGGFTAKALNKIPAINKTWGKFTGYFKGLYKDLTEVAEYKIKKDELNQITKVLSENNFGELAQKYTRIGEYAQDGDFIKLGAKDKKIKPLINFVIAPFKFAWNTIMLPYNLVMKVVNVFTKKAKTMNIAIKDKETLNTIVENYAKNIKGSNVEDLKGFIAKISSGKVPVDVKLSEVEQGLLNRISDISSLAKSIENIGKEAKKKNLNPEQFQTYVRDNIMKAFNADTMSNLSNSELSNLAKTAASIATIWFLMTDNYNMVMLKSNGNDVEGAKTKFTERFVQEGSRLFYQTLLIDLFNSTFRSQYNKSLFGMSWITLTNTTMGEWLTRKSVGVAVKPHTRDELIEIEKEQENATGAKKKYYNFMKRLTGKRSIKTYEVPAKTEQKQA